MDVDGSVGPPRHEREFSLMFDDDWTPAHLTGGPMNLYKEIALALKGLEWRKPGLVAFASKLVASTGPHTPIAVHVPASYEPATAPNPWVAIEKALHQAHPPPAAQAQGAATAGEDVVQGAVSTVTSNIRGWLSPSGDPPSSVALTSMSDTHLNA